MSSPIRPLARLFACALALTSLAGHADLLELSPAGPHILSLRAIGAASLLPSNASPLVAVLDTGFQINHPALAGKLVAGYNVYTGGTDVGLKASDPLLYTHGTAVAGIISADPTLPLWPRAVFPAARILPIKICCDDASGQTNSNLLREGILYAAGIRNDYGLASPERAAVINISYVVADLSDTNLLDAIQQATRAGSVVVTALGENAPVMSPAMENVTGILGVMVAADAQSLPQLDGPMPAIPAPGSNLPIVLPAGSLLGPVPSTGTTTGSSFATAVASAVAAMVVAANPNLSPGDVAAILSSPSIYDAQGLDAVLAVQKADTLPSPPTQGASGGSSSSSSEGGSGGGAFDGLSLCALVALALARRSRRQSRSD